MAKEIIYLVCFLLSIVIVSGSKGRTAPWGRRCVLRLKTAGLGVCLERARLARPIFSVPHKDLLLRFVYGNAQWPR